MINTYSKIIFVTLLIGHHCSLVAQTAKLFTLLSPDQTNVHFENTVKDTKESNIFIYSNYYGGAGVGVGDFNNDGMQDIFFTANLVGDKLYLNRGNMVFEDATEAAGIKNNGGWSSGVAIADVNNDGWLDIFVCRELYDDKPDLRKEKLYINNGEAGAVPTFTERAEEFGVANTERSRHATFLDYDKDGDLDLFILNQPPNAGNFSDLYGTKPEPKFSSRLYSNGGNGTFTDVTKSAGVLKAGYPNSVTASDLNNDGWTDLYVACDFDTPDLFYINNGNGTFTNILDEAMQHISYYSMGVDAADINNDGWLDLMVVDMAAEDNFRIKSNMSGMNPKAFWKVVKQGGHYQYMFNTLQLNNPLPINQKNSKQKIVFSDISQLAGMSSTDWSWSNLITDLDNDGFKDIYVTNGLLKDIRNTDSDKAVAHHIEDVTNEFVKKNPNAGDVSLWDILDLEATIKMVPEQKVANYAFRNNGDLSFTKVATEWGLDTKSFSHGSAYADFDNDGDLDLVVNNVNDVAYIYRNNAESLLTNGYFRVKLTDNKNHTPVFGTRIQIELNGKQQLVELTNVRGMYSTSENIAHFGTGTSKVIDKLIITWPDGKITERTSVSTNQVLLIDYQEAITKKNSAPTNATILFEKASLIPYKHTEDNFDDFSKQVLLPHKMSQFGPALAVGDVNGDGLEDCFSGAATGYGSKLFLQQPSGEFLVKNTPAFEQDAIYEDIDAAFFDADGDKDLDLYVVSGGNNWKPQADEYKHRLYTNDGKGNFIRSQKSIPSVKESGSCVRPFDYDKDGDLDLFIGGRHVPWDYPSPATSRILQNEKGIFKDVTKSIANDLLNIGLVTDAAWTDFDQDGLTDIVLTGEWMPITFIKYDGKRFVNATQQFGISDSEGWWYNIEAADMDGDGDQDLIGGNLGLNYKYKASVKEPFEVYYYDFDESGTNDIVLSYYNFGEKYPLRGRSCSSEQIPQLRDKFKSYNMFASANLTEVYGVKNLQSAMNYQAKTFASAYFENQGKGKFSMTPLPNEAQLSSINDFIVDDFDGDGSKDILLAGNLFATEIETPRNDAGIGLLLKGNGKGKFEAVPATRSGFYLPADVKKLTMITGAKHKWILGGINNADVATFRIVKQTN